MRRNEEAELIRKVRAGNVHAFRSLMEAHQGRAYATALRLMAHPELAEEMVQDAFVQAYRKLEQFRGEASFGTWLQRILTRLCLDHLRRKGLSTTELLPESKAATVPEQAHRALEQADTRQQVRLVMAQLPPKERLVLQLFYLDERSLKEIRAETGFSLSNVKTLLHRARKRFRSLMPSESSTQPSSIPERLNS